MPLMPGAEPWSQQGNRVGVVVLHGFTGSPKSVRPWAADLAAEGWTVDVPRLPGHGTRWQDMNLTTWQDWYAEAQRAVHRVQEVADHVFVMGLSMGGTLTLRLAQEYGSQISGIALVNPSVQTERPDRFLLPLLSRVLPSFPGISNDIAKEGMDEGAYDRIPLKAAHSLSQMWQVVRSDLPRVSQPLVLFRSATDHVVEASNAALILDKVSSHDVEEIVLPDSFHVATLDHDAPVITRESIAFVRRISGE